MQRHVGRLACAGGSGKWWLFHCLSFTESHFFSRYCDYAFGNTGSLVDSLNRLNTCKLPVIRFQSVITRVANLNLSSPIGESC